MHLTPITITSTRTEGPVLAHDFLLGDVPGVLWTPLETPADSPVPLVLAGQPGGFSLERMRPRLAQRAASSARLGLATAALEMPDAGARTPLAGVDDARVRLRAAVAAGERVPADVIDALVLPLVDAAVPEWQALLDAVGVGVGVEPVVTDAPLPRFAPAAGFSGGLASIGVRLAAVEPRLAAAVIYAGSYLPRSIIEQARHVRIPIHQLLQWDDEGNDRGASLELFDAFGSAEKTLTANLGGHTGVPEHAGEAAERFLERHLLDAAAE